MRVLEQQQTLKQGASQGGFGAMTLPCTRRCSRITLQGSWISPTTLPRRFGKAHLLLVQLVLNRKAAATNESVLNSYSTLPKIVEYCKELQEVPRIGRTLLPSEAFSNIAFCFVP